MPLIQFTLTMPNNNSWNGKWSGEGNLYAAVENIRSVKVCDELLKTDYHHYNFGDGWAAGVSIKEIDAATARKVRKQSRGFCGYNWMISSIKNHGKIIPPPVRA